MTFGVGVTDVAQLAQRENIKDTLRADTDGPDLVAIFRDVQQDTGAWMLVVGPHPEVATHYRVHVLKRIGTAGLDRFAHFSRHLIPPKSGAICVKPSLHSDGDAAAV